MPVQLWREKNAVKLRSTVGGGGVVGFVATSSRVHLPKMGRDEGIPRSKLSKFHEIPRNSTVHANPKSYVSIRPSFLRTVSRVEKHVVRRAL